MEAGAALGWLGDAYGHAADAVSGAYGHGHAAWRSLQSDDDIPTSDPDAALDVVAVNVWFGIVWAVIIFAATFSVKRIKQTEVMLIERFGKFQKILKPGLHFIIPVLEQPRTIHWRYYNIRPNTTTPILVTEQMDRVDTREHVLDFSKQTVITRDTVAISINALAYFVIRDPRLAVYKIDNLPYAIELLVQSTLRNLVAKITLDDAFSSREQINADLLHVVSKDAQRWGIEIRRVEVVEIEPPPDIKAAMESQITAERARRSAVLQADGLRESTIVSRCGRPLAVFSSLRSPFAANSMARMLGQPGRVRGGDPGCRGLPHAGYSAGQGRGRGQAHEVQGRGRLDRLPPRGAG